MKTFIVLNPVAGSVGALAELEEKFRRLKNAEVRVTTKQGDAESFSRDAVDRGCDLIVAAGGDGTLNAVINGIGERIADVSIGLVPLGTGNDFARSLNLSKDVDESIECLERRRTRQIDLVRVTSDSTRYFVNVSAGGFSGIVNEKLTPEMKATWGPLAYLRGAAEALPELCAYRTEMLLDDSEQVAMNLYNVIVANGRYVAGGIPIAPDASVDDGLLDIILIPERPAGQLALLMGQILMGEHLKNEAIVFRRAAKLAVNSHPGIWFNVDGELVGNEPAVFEIMPRGLRFVVGETDV
ncbi:MAG: diacylglycerol kinase family protein [Verrucomicrobiota bacterium]